VKKCSKKCYDPYTPLEQHIRGLVDYIWRSLYPNKSGKNTFTEFTQNAKAPTYRKIPRTEQYVNVHEKRIPRALMTVKCLGPFYEWYISSFTHTPMFGSSNSNSISTFAATAFNHLSRSAWVHTFVANGNLFNTPCMITYSCVDVIGIFDNE
jgi:hypothetical protein